MAGIIPKETLKDICKIGQGEACCRYILCGLNGFECGKHSAIRDSIDKNVNKMTAKGDNCRGIN